MSVNYLRNSLTKWGKFRKTLNYRRNGGSLVEARIEDEVGILVLNDSARLNALTVSMGTLFKAEVESMIHQAKDEKIKALVVTGSGTAFSAGGDLLWLEDRHYAAPAANSETMVEFYNLFLSIRQVPVPTVAAINGAAVGAGLCMCLACDARVVADSAKLGFTFTKIGIHPGMGASVLLPRLVGYERATQLLLSGDLVSGTEAKEMGLAIETTSPENVLSRAVEVAKSMGGESSIALRTCLQTLRNQKFQGLDPGLRREADAQALAYASPDFLSRITALRTRVSRGKDRASGDKP